MVDSFSCILDPPPLIKGIHHLNPQNLSSTTTIAAKGKKKKKKKKKKSWIAGRWGMIFVVWFVIGLFETFDLC